MCNTVTLIATILLGQPADPGFDPNPPPPPVRALPAPVQKVFDGYLKAIDQKDLEAMANLAAVPWLDNDRQLVRERDKLGEALKAAASRLSKAKKAPTVLAVPYKEIRGTIEEESDQKLLDEVVGEDGWLVALMKEIDPISIQFVLIRVKGETPKIVGGPLKQNQVISQNRIPEIVLEAFEKSDTFELYSLDPRRLDDDGKPLVVKDGFHNWKVLGKTEVKAPAQRKRLIDALRKGAEDNPGTVAACFNPRHGIRMKVDGKTVDLVICFECLSVQVLVADKAIKGFLTTGAPQRAFDAVLKKAGVTLPKQAEESEE